MDTSILQSLASKSPPSTNPLLLKASSSTTTCIQVSLPHHRRLAKVCCTNSSTDNTSSSTSGSEAPSPVPPPITPPDAAEIRFKRGSRRRRQQLQQEDGFRDGERQRMKVKAAADPAPKKWDEMSLTEKALELYVGEKGLLFWLNKFAYASIFFVIGAWILFRFVGPALNLYELDSPPSAPTSMFKGS